MYVIYTTHYIKLARTKENKNKNQKKTKIIILTINT